MNDVVLGLGSSLGDRTQALKMACAVLSVTPGLTLLKKSRVAWTPAAGGVAKGPFLNAALLCQTSLSPENLLVVCKNTETLLGRKAAPRFADRRIDIDILLFGSLILETELLQIPHPRLKDRDFFLDLLQEVKPGAWNPLTQTPWPSPVRCWPRVACLA
jgi:2-amino-4-hydroxy-6-hydroxymethyldihydropteridine diphosphokinase